MKNIYTYVPCHNIRKNNNNNNNHNRKAKKKAQDEELFLWKFMQSHSPVLDLIVSLPTVCPSKSYWFNRELSPSTTTEFEAFFVQVYVTSVVV